MRKERSYDFKKVDVCRNCHGRGRVIEHAPAKPSLRFNPEQVDTFNEIECEVCEGTGRIVKTTHVDITIESYTGGPI